MAQSHLTTQKPHSLLLNVLLVINLNNELEI